MASPKAVAAQLSCWSSPVTPEPLSGGITNTNFVVTDAGETFVVRIGDDQPHHGIVRSHEVATCRAAYECGLSPEIVHSEPGALVMRFIDARTLSAQDVRDPGTLARILELIRRCHNEMQNHVPETSPKFWVFQVCRNYLTTIETRSCRLASRLSDLADKNSRLERSVGPVDAVFCHNDLLPANFLDDGERLWLIDWEYAGWNTALFDLASLASNSQMTTDQQQRLLETYFTQVATGDDMARFQAVACASLLRESLWSMVQEQHSTIDFDFETYTDDNLRQFESAFEELGQEPSR